MFLCLDYGDRYIGLAATDPEGKIPYRYGVIDQKQQDVWEALKATIHKERIQTILVGVPVSLKGHDTEQTKKVRSFISTLRSVVGDEAEIVEVDETLTSVEARRILQHEGGAQEDEHAEAARLMLQEYIKGVWK
jgi:putative holliday junction resolvase